MKTLIDFTEIYGYSKAVAGFVLKSGKALGMPVSMAIEPTNICNLRCPLCSTGSGTLCRDKGIITYKDYMTLLEKIPVETKNIYLWGQGEPLLAPDFLKMASETSKYGKRIHVSTNGHYLDDVKSIIKSGIYKLIISLDGITPEKYNYYRKGGDFDKVTGGIKSLSDMKKIAGAGPIIELQCLITKINAGDMEEYRKFASSIGADKTVFKTLQAASVEDGMSFLPDDPQFSRYENAETGLVTKKNIFLAKRCMRIYYSAQTDWQGNVLPCCFDKDSEYIMGNLFESSFADIWNSEKYIKFRKTIAEKGRVFPMCGDCTEGLTRMSFQ